MWLFFSSGGAVMLLILRVPIETWSISFIGIYQLDLVCVVSCLGNNNRQIAIWKV